jgi:hypothetical protein
MEKRKRQRPARPAAVQIHDRRQYASRNVDCPASSARRAPTSRARIMHEQTGEPSSQTVQAEQAPRWQARPNEPRNASARVVRGSTCSLRAAPVDLQRNRNCVWPDRRHGLVTCYLRLREKRRCRVDYCCSGCRQRAYLESLRKRTNSF